jgi:hypothetical protein
LDRSGSATSDPWQLGHVVLVWGAMPILQVCRLRIGYLIGDEHFFLATFITCAFLNFVVRFIIRKATLDEANGPQDDLIIQCRRILWRELKQAI